MSSLRKSLAKAKAKAKNLLHPAERSSGRQSKAQTTKDTDRSTSSLSSPASLHDDTQKPLAQATDRTSLTRDHAARPSQFLDTNPSSAQQSLSTMLVPNPWEAWALDRDFLYQVYIWDLKHPENTLNRVFNKISAAIEKHGILLELAPDGPIPIRGFIKALAHVVKLGTDMAVAKMAALEFAQGVLKWVEKLAAALGEGGSGRFISGAWENLADIRELIERVCTWAHRMLNVELMERASVKERILEFQQQFTQAIERFGVISNIQIGIGQDQIYQRLDSLHNDTNRQFRTLQDRLTLQSQPQQSMPDVTYQFQNKIPCDPGTRKQVLAEIMNWISDISESSPCFFWLSGDPGVGKSAVTASIAQECKRRKILWAQFFINRNDASTVNPQLYFPIIVKQMAERDPAVDFAVQNFLREQPDLMKDDIAIQARELFLKTVQVASGSTPGQPIAIVIDALDETDLKRLKVTAEVFAHILVDLPRNVKVFISSRVETVIRDNFQPHPRAKNIHLSARSSRADVAQFLEAKVHEIMTEFHMNQSHWGHERMQKLCSQASGLFIWAVTAVAYLRTQIEDFGTERLNVVLDELITQGMGNINVLYMAILKQTYHQREASPWQTQCFQRIMGAIFAQQSPLSIDNLKGLLNLRNSTTRTLVDVEHFIRRFRTVLVPGTGEINGQTVPHVHKSFVDFVTSAEAQEFRVDMVASHGELALRSIDQLEILWHRSRNSQSNNEIPRQLRYATLHWSSHLTHVVGAPVQQEETDHDGDEKSIDDERSQTSTPNLERDVDAPVPKIPSFQLPNFGETYSICISPDGTCIAYAHGRSVLLRDLETGNYIGKPFDDHTGFVTIATFSPDGRHIVSGCDDTIYIWDVETRTPVRLGDSSRTNRYAAVFSPDGKQIISGSSDGTIHLWDAMTGQILHLFKGHTGTIFSAFFSPDAKRIVSASKDLTVRVWDTATGKAVHVFEDHMVDHAVNDTAANAFFSPDGKTILSTSRFGTIIIWDAETGRRIPEYFTDLGSTDARLVFIDSETAAYIETPSKSIVNPQNDTTSPSYIFNVNHERSKGKAGGVLPNAWVYFNKQPRFTINTYLGQVMMISHL